MLKRTLNSELIAKFSKALNEINALKETNNYEEALKLANSTFLDLFRLKISFLSSLYYTDIIALNKKNGKLDIEKTLIMGVLLSEYENTTCHIENESDFYINEKAIHLMLDAFEYNDSDTDFNNYFSYIDLVYEKIKDYHLSQEITYKLVYYFKQTGKYNSAENLIYDLLEDNNFSEDCIKKSLVFYEELLTKQDEDLINGDLPRDEILESINSLKQKL